MSGVNWRLPVQIDQVSIVGNKRTNVKYFEKELQEALHSCNNVLQLKTALDRATANMENQQIFEGIHTDLHIKSAEHGKFRADIKVVVEEKGIPFLNAGTSVRANAANPTAAINASILGAIRNAAGHGEVLRASLGTNDPTSLQPAERFISAFIPNAVAVPTRWLYNLPKKTNSVSSSPLSPITQLDLSVTAKVANENAGYFLGYNQRADTLGAELRTRDAKHIFEVEISGRDEIPLKQPHYTPSGSAEVAVNEAQALGSQAANPFVLARSACSTKVSAKYSFMALNTLDSMCNPSRGALVKGSVEVATPLGTAQFMRGDISAARHIAVGPTLFGSSSGATLSLCSSVGMILPFSALHRLRQSHEHGGFLKNVTDDVNLCDRYHLGGPMSIRGFDQYGISPQIIPPAGDSTIASKPLLRPEGLSTGSFSRFSALAMLSVPIPIRSLAHSGAKAFAFVNGGLLGDASSRACSNESKFWGSPKISTGVGFVVPVANAFRLEFTYAVPLTRSASDVMKPFQLGVGITIN